MDSLDFLNQNSLRGFPIKEGCSRISEDGLFTIPDDFMVDLTLSAGAEVSDRLYVSKIHNLPTEIIIEISKDATLVGSFNIITADHTIYKDYYFNASSTYEGAVGKLTVAYLSTMAVLPSGPFTFTLETGELEARTIIPTRVGVRRIVFNEEFSKTGSVVLSARSNMQFRSNFTGTYLDAGNGLGLNKNPVSVVPAIRTINGIEPDENGNFTISLLDCESLVPTTNGLVLTDSCNKPCMGCDEISTLTDRLINLESDLLSLRKYFDDLNQISTQLNNAVNYSCELQ